MKQQSQPKDPCRTCYLHGLCDSDECGRKLYEIDVNNPIGASHWHRTASPLEERKMNRAKYIRMRNNAINRIWTRL